MNNRILIFLALGSLVLLGAGCVQNIESDNATTATEDEFKLTETEIKSSAAESNFYLSAVATGPNRVEFSWTVPDEMDTSGGFRILSSSKPEPTIPGAYWDWVAPNLNEITLTDVIAGIRYFRICQWLGTGCGEYSNEVILNIE